MRPKTSKRLRITIVFVVAALMAVIVGASVALADMNVAVQTTTTCAGSGTIHWNGTNGQEHNHCEYGGQLHWILNTSGGQLCQPSTLHVTFEDGSTGSFPGSFSNGMNCGSAMHFYSQGSSPVASAYVDYLGCGVNNLVISHLVDDVCNTTTTVGDEETTTTVVDEETTTTVGDEETTTTVAPTTTVAGLTTTTVGTGCLTITKTIGGDNPQGLTCEDFTVVVTGPAPSSDVVYDGTFDEFCEIEICGLLPGIYTVTEEWPGYPWEIEGNGSVEVLVGDNEPVEITNTGVTSTTVAEEEGTTTTLGTDTTTPRGTTTTVFGWTTESTTPDTTAFGWVAQPDDIQTGGGGAAGGHTALIVLILASTLLTSVVVASVVGVRAGVL